MEHRSFDKQYDVAVIGAGHAGIEAASAAARLGSTVLLLTQNLDTVAQMSCNPAIGGLAKGHIVCEIDALGGFMGANADATGIHFRLLNRAKGPSVRSPRVQCDKKAYQFRAKACLEGAKRIDLKQAAVTDFLVEDGAIAGVVTDIGICFRAKAVVLTSGTFLRGLLHIGRMTKQGGRMADASSGLTAALESLGIESRRFKTGTPCRISRRSVDFSRCLPQAGEEPPTFFSFDSARAESAKSDIFTLNTPPFHVEQMPCWITHTSERTHEIIRSNLDRSPLYCGQIEGTGPRYCPSIEDKVVKFQHKQSHQLFLEPEGLHTEEMYVNGVSTSLPVDVQYAFLRTVPGLEKVEVLRPGYAVEYDYFPPTQLHPTLESKIVPSLFFAGQVNGTSGYEEAAAQGLVAGANASLRVQGKPPFVPKRSEGYIGVLVDDLVSRGTDEPYRMFTSRAEDRLRFRYDNADQRLTPLGRAIGLVDDDRWQAFGEKMRQLDTVRQAAAAAIVDGQRLSALLRQPQFAVSSIPPETRRIAPDAMWESLATDLRYEGYILRQATHNAHIGSRHGQVIPSDLNFAELRCLRPEARQKLAKVRPATLGHATTLSGVTPADISALHIFLRQRATIVPDPR
ncbi:MAG TPA: tRNA uridine-5-carboxymethylaminomethyl(34) synthesis enzyme MnmG [Chthoniobacterales bacterium]